MVARSGASKAMMLQCPTFEPEFSTLIRVLEKGARHVVDSCHSCAFPATRTAHESHILPAYIKHQKPGSEILAEVTL
jgi:hypothetical protein